MKFPLMTVMAGLLSAALLAACDGTETYDAPVPAVVPKNILFFLGDGMGMTTLNAARIYKVGEDG